MNIEFKSLRFAGILIAQTALISISSAAGVSGNWVWVTPGRNGAPDRESVLSLKAEGSHLTGKISAPGPDGKPTDTLISNGTVDGETVRFDVVRQVNGSSSTNSYLGKKTGEKLVGEISSIRDGQVRSRAWEARDNGRRSEAAAVPPPKPGYNEQGYKIVNETRYKELSVEEAEAYLKQYPDTVVLDLRPPSSFAAGHLPGAVSLDVTDDQHYQEVLKPLDKSKRYLVHSVTGHYRTVRALEYFEQHGFEHAVALKGGYQAWVTAGKPVVK